MSKWLAWYTDTQRQRNKTWPTSYLNPHCACAQRVNRYHIRLTLHLTAIESVITLQVITAICDRVREKRAYVGETIFELALDFINTMLITPL